MISVPWLGGADNNFMTNEVLWPTFEAMWPLTLTPGGENNTSYAVAGHTPYQYYLAAIVVYYATYGAYKP